MRPKTMMQFFRGMFRFLLRQIAAYTFNNFPDEPAPGDANAEERKRADQAVEVEVYEIKRTNTGGKG